MIKYKGRTSRMLSDISLELTGKVDLRTSEIILKGFFQRILKEVSKEKNIEILCSLPAYLKPFCEKPKEIREIEHTLFHSNKSAHTLQSIFKVLEKYVSKENHETLSKCIPSILFSKIPSVKKEVSLAA